MTRKTAERKVREQLGKSYCRGKLILPLVEQKQYQKRWEAAKKSQVMVDQLICDLEDRLAERADELFSMVVDLRGPAIDWYTVIIDDVWGRVMGMIWARGSNVGRPCGHKIADVICSGPFDGRQHEYVCPGCGRKGHYTAPRFDGLKE